MDLEVIKQNGEKFLLSDYDVVVQDIKIYSIPMLHNRQRIDGFDGSLSHGTEYGDRKIEVTATFIAKDLHDYAHLRDELFNLLNDPDGYYIRELRRLNKKQYEFIDLNEKPKEKTGTDNSYVNGKQYYVELDGEFEFEQDDVYGATTINFKTSGLPFAESVYTTKELHDTKYNAEASSIITDRDRERFSDTVNKKVDGIEIGGRNLLQKTNMRNWANANLKIGENLSWRGWFAKVEPNTVYSLSRQKMSSRFRYYLLIEKPYLNMELT